MLLIGYRSQQVSARCIASYPWQLTCAVRRYIICLKNISVRPQESIPWSLTYCIPATQLSVRLCEKVLLSFIGLKRYLIKINLQYAPIDCQQFYDIRKGFLDTMETEE